MLEQTNDIIIVQNNIIKHKTSLEHANQGYTITYQYNKTQNNIIRYKTKL